MSTIRVTPQELRDKGDLCKGKSEEMDNICKQLDRMKNELEQIWEGESSRAFSREYESLRPRLTEFVNLIMDVGTQLRRTGDALEEADKNIAGQIGIR